MLSVSSRDLSRPRPANEQAGLAVGRRAAAVPPFAVMGGGGGGGIGVAKQGVPTLPPWLSVSASLSRSRFRCHDDGLG